jgi:hypothetical protein
MCEGVGIAGFGWSHTSLEEDRTGDRRAEVQGVEA